MTFTEENFELFKADIMSLTDDKFFQCLALNKFVDADTMYAREYIMKNDFLKEEIQRRILMADEENQENGPTFKYGVFEISTVVPLWALTSTHYKDEDEDEKSQEVTTTYHYKEDEVERIIKKYQATGMMAYEDDSGVYSKPIKNLRVFKLDAHYNRRPMPIAYP